MLLGLRSPSHRVRFQGLPSLELARMASDKPAVRRSDPGTVIPGTVIVGFGPETFCGGITKKAQAPDAAWLEACRGSYARLRDLGALDADQCVALDVLSELGHPWHPCATEDIYTGPRDPRTVGAVFAAVDCLCRKHWLCISVIREDQHAEADRYPWFARCSGSDRLRLRHLVVLVRAKEGT